jgi:hypothetical protein
MAGKNDREGRKTAKKAAKGPTAAAAARRKKPFGDRHEEEARAIRKKIRARPGRRDEEPKGRFRAVFRVFAPVDGGTKLTLRRPRPARLARFAVAASGSRPRFFLSLARAKMTFDAKSGPIRRIRRFRISRLRFFWGGRIKNPGRRKKKPSRERNSGFRSGFGGAGPWGP